MDDFEYTKPVSVMIFEREINDEWIFDAVNNPD